MERSQRLLDAKREYLVPYVYHFYAARADRIIQFHDGQVTNSPGALEKEHVAANLLAS